MSGMMTEGRARNWSRQCAAQAVESSTQQQPPMQPKVADPSRGEAQWRRGSVFGIALLTSGRRVRRHAQCNRRASRSVAT
jgi:hypothetical protein